MEADIGNTRWVKFENGYKFQEASVSITLPNILLTDSQFLASRCLMIGPPLFPIIPKFRNWSNRPMKIGFRIKIESANDSVTLDLYRIQAILPDGSLIQPVAVYTDEKDGVHYDIQIDWATTGHTGRLLKPGDTTLSKESMNYNLQFDHFPANIEEITLNFGSVQINGKEVLLTPLKFHKLTKYWYVWGTGV